LFFVSYIIFQPFATAVIRRLGPRKFISTIILTWGAVMVVSDNLLSFAHTQHSLSHAFRDRASSTHGNNWQV
jgi:hypothetical protein